MKRFVLGWGLILLNIFLSACIGVEMRFVFNTTGAGRFIFKYKVSEEMRGFTDASSSANNVLPDISLKTIEKKIKENPALKLIALNQSEDEKNIYINGEIEFNSLEALQKSGMVYFPCSLKQEGNRSVFRIMYVHNREKVDAKLLDLIRLLFADYKLQIIVEAPRKIADSSEGSLSNDGRTLTLVYKMEDYLQLAGDQELRVSW